MQSNKTSKKTRKIAEETVSPAPDTAITSDTTATPRGSKSSKPKNETGETAAAKRHRKAATAVVPHEDSAAATATAAAITPQPAIEGEMDAITARRSSEEVARLAYSYWLARGCAHGSHQEDWFRAERELASR